MSLILAMLFMLAPLLQTPSLPGPGPTIHAAPAPTITFVQGCVNSASASSVTCAMGSNITAGDLLVITSKTGTTVSGSSITLSTSSGVSLTFVQAVGSVFQSKASFTTALYTALVSTTGAETVQASWSGNGNFTDIAVAEYHTTKSWQSPVLDQSASNVGATSSTSCPTGTTPATTNANDLVVALAQDWNEAETWGALSGWTQRPSASRNTTGWYDQNVTATGTQGTTIVLSTADYSVGMVAAFMSN